MSILARLGLGFGAVVATFALAGALILWNVRLLRETDDRVRDRVSFNELALEYRHAALDATLGAGQFASGNPLGEQRILEGTAGMASSREQLRARVSGDAAVREFAELERVEKLTVEAAERVMTLVRSKAAPALVQQELAFLSARSDALDLRLEALYDETREEVAISTALSDHIGARVQKQTSLAIFGCVLFAALVSVLVFRSIARPLSRLDAGVRKIAEGDLDHVIAVTSKDEIGELTVAFNDMTKGLRGAMTALDGRNQDMRLVLDHVSQGLLTMDRDGVVSAERSAVVDAWLGEIGGDTKLWDHFEPLAPRFALSLKMGWEAVLDDFLPLELTIQQMPKAVTIGERQLTLAHQPIKTGEVVSRLLVVVSDVTAQLANEAARERDREAMAIFQAVQRDKEGFLEFFSDGAELVASLGAEASDGDLATLKRAVHTLKGNCGIFGVGSVAAACHALETTMEAEERGPQPEELSALTARWGELALRMKEIVGDSAKRIEIDDDEFTAILQAIARGRPRRDIAQMVGKWRMERVQHRLERLGDQARALAERLGKGAIEVKVETGGLRLPRETFTKFWGSFVHAVRNALDHGLETPAEREAANKPAWGTLSLACKRVEDEISIELADDGRGIDWEKIAAKARERGLPAETEEDLVQALFSDGVSTADSVTEVSGRGVGMAALRDACSKLAGRILIESARGEGTRMSFRFPEAVMLDETTVMVSALSFTDSLMPPRAVSIRPSALR